jgi:putative ABC transport system permease protein
VRTKLIRLIQGEFFYVFARRGRDTLKKIKFIISFIVIMAALLIIGESHQLYLNNFNTAYSSTTMFLQENTTTDEMVEDILDSAKRNDVEVFALISNVRSTFLKENNIYGTDGVEQHINNDLNVFEKNYKSFLLGTTQVNFHDFRDIPNIANVNDYNVIGSKENVHQFKMDLIDKYAGNHPDDGYPDKDSFQLVFFIWLLVIIVILFLSFYDVILQKKENVIRISLGERIGAIIWKNIIFDTIAYVVIFLLLLLLLSRYTHVLFQLPISLAMIASLLVINAALYFNLYFYDLKQVFSNVRSSRKLLTMNYGLKLITVFLTVLIISGNIAAIMEGYKFYKQRPFFEAHADYYYTNLAYKRTINSDSNGESLIDKDQIMNETFYRSFFEKFDATTLVNFDHNHSNDYGNVILANRNALDYLTTQITELRDTDLTKDIYYIMPKARSNDQDMITNLNSWIKTYEGEAYEFEYDVIYYEDDIEVISIDEFYLNGSDWIKNPILIYNHTDASTATYPINEKAFKLTYQHDIMYKISEPEFHAFVEEFDLTDQFISITNVWEKYEHQWNIVKRILYMNVILSVLVLMLELIIIHSIIRLEYEVNAIELSVKKIFGYSNWEKNKKILLMTIISTVISIIAAIIVGAITKVEEVYYIAAGGVFILILEAFVIFFNIRKIEESSIQKILKGGSL